MPKPNRQDFAGIAGGQKTPPSNGGKQGTGNEGEGAQGQGTGNEGSGGTGGTDGGAGAEQGQRGQQEAKYTDDDVNDIITKRLARERAKMEREIRDNLAREQQDQQTEAEKLRNMTELQRAQYEAKKLREEKEALEAERDLSQQMGIARRELSAAGITMGDELLSMFVSAEAEKTGAAIDKLKELWPKAVNEAVQRELRREPPSAEQQPGGKSFGASFAQKYNKQQNGGK